MTKHKSSALWPGAITMPSKVGLKSFIQCMMAPAIAMFRGPPTESTKMLLLLPTLPRSVGFRPMAPAQTCFAHRAIRRLPFPVHAAQLLAFFYRDRPDGLQRPTPTQRWKVRWMVLSSPTSLGRWFHWQLLCNLKRIPSNILTWSTRLRLLVLGGSNSRVTGSIRSQRSPGTSQIVANGFPSTTIHVHTPLGTILATPFTHQLQSETAI